MEEKTEEIIFTSPKKRGRVAVFLSGRGSNFLSLARASQEKRLNADIVLVFSNKADAPGLQKAKELGLETLCLNAKTFPSREEFDQAIMAEVSRRQIDLICLAGYMRVITPEFCEAWKFKIINIHPSLLPAFPGLNAQKQAFDWGVRYSGCTVHFVFPEVDMGPIILQTVVPVLDDDTEEILAARILEQEHIIYPEAVKLYFEGRLEVKGRKVFIRNPLV